MTCKKKEAKKSSKEGSLLEGNCRLKRTWKWILGYFQVTEFIEILGNARRLNIAVSAAAWCWRGGCVALKWLWRDTHVQGQISPSKMVGGAKLHLESNPIPARDAQRAQANLVHATTQRTHRDWARTVFECLLWRYRSAVACRRGRGSGCSRPGDGISPLGGGHH